MFGSPGSVLPGNQFTNLPGPIAVHCSTGQLGGGEASLVEHLSHIAGIRDRVFFILPEAGALANSLSAAGIPYRVLPLPEATRDWSRDGWWRITRGIGGIPAFLWNWNRYIDALAQTLGPARTLVSSGLRSHCLLALWPSSRSAVPYGVRLVFNVRDFIRPPWLRVALAHAFRAKQAMVIANSAAVARGYSGARVQYPQVALPRAPKRAAPKDRPLIAHLAFWAPYKGQHRFLEFARRFLDTGGDADFVLAGDVIYPGSRYRADKREVLERLDRLGLRHRVRLVGVVRDVQGLLERTDILLHCTLRPEPYGRVIMEALLCGSSVMCHSRSGVCELLGAGNSHGPEVWRLDTPAPYWWYSPGVWEETSHAGSESRYRAPWST